MVRLILTSLLVTVSLAYASKNKPTPKTQPERKSCFTDSQMQEIGQVLFGLKTSLEFCQNRVQRCEEDLEQAKHPLTANR